MVRGPMRPGWLDTRIAKSLKKPNGLLRRIVKRGINSGIVPFQAFDADLPLLELRAGLQMTSDTPLELRLHHLSGIKDILLDKTADPADLEVRIGRDIIPNMFADKEVLFSKFLGSTTEDADISVKPADPRESIIDRILGDNVLGKAEREIVERTIDSKKVQISNGKEESLMTIPFSIDKNLCGVVLLAGKKINENDIEMARKFSRSASIALKNAIDFKSLDRKARNDMKLDIPNFYELSENLEIEVDRAKRYGHHLAFVMIDIDHFKAVNDTYGHKTGDEVLKRITEIIKEEKRKYDIIGRYGGEEFGLILPETNKETAAEITNRIRRRIEQEVFTTSDGQLRVTISAGISEFKEDISSRGDNLIEKADDALYKAKGDREDSPEGGRNRVAYERNGEWVVVN